MKQRIAVVLMLGLMVLSGCSGSVRSRTNNETINASPCSSAQRVGAGSCNVQVWKFGGGN